MEQNESQPPQNLSISRAPSETWSKHGRTGFSLFPPRQRTVSMVFLRGNAQPDRKRRVILAEATDASHAAILIAIPINWCSCNTRVLSLMRDSDKSTRGSWHPKSASVRPIREAEVSLLALVLVVISYNVRYLRSACQFILKGPFMSPRTLDPVK